MARRDRNIESDNVSIVIDSRSLGKTGFEFIDSDWQRDWELALETCRGAACDLFEPSSDVTLCHGLAGCVEPLLEAGQHDELNRLWLSHEERFGERNTWPSGLPSRGPNPSLVLGTAGVGYTFLRMHDPKTPSVLLPLLNG